MKLHLKILGWLLSAIVAIIFPVLPCSAQQTELPSADEPSAQVVAYGVSPKTTTTMISCDSLRLGLTHGLRVVPKPAPIYCTNPTRSIRKATLNVRLKMGATDYTFDSTAFSMAVNLYVVGLDVSGSPVATYPCVLQIGSWLPPQKKVIPEQVFTTDFTNDYPSIDSLAVYIVGESDNFIPLPGATELKNSAKLEISYDEEWNLSQFNQPSLPQIPFINAHVTTEGDSTTAPRVEFTWTLGTDCNDSVGNYQIQILRLYNIDPTRVIDEKSIKADIDWSQAMTLETGSGKQSIVLTLAEGSGYYAYRVRPIGNRYPNGAGDERNWGDWTDAPAQGTEVDLPLDMPLGGLFFYRQFDEDLNWIYHRQFSESDDGTQIAEGITYATSLLQAKQQQQYLKSSDAYVTTQTVYDYSGRPALTSLPSPVYSRPGFGYIPGALNYNSGTGSPELYTADNFDSDAKLHAPDPINDGVTDYYSNANPDLTIPDAEGYPFARTLYLQDGLGRPKESGGPGAVHRIGSTAGGNKTRTSRTYYGTATDDELVRLFGDEAPASVSVQKVLSVDPNNMVHVAYIDNAGQTIATCMARGIDQDILQPLDEPDMLDATVSDIITDNVPFGDRGLRSSKAIVVPQPTTLHVHYELNPKSIQDACANFCATCDYVVTITVHNLDDPAKSVVLEPMYMAGGECPGTQPVAIDENVDLPNPGTYVVERVIETANSDPGSVTIESPLGRTYLEEHAATVVDNVTSSIDGTLAEVYDRLNHNDVAGLYDYLENTLMLSPDENDMYHVNIPTGCGVIDIPKKSCENDACRVGLPDFEDLLHQMWDKGRSNVTLDDFFFTDGNPTYQNAPSGEAHPFNDMVRRMVDSAGYDCTQLYDVWLALMHAYPMLATTDGSGDPTKLDKNFDLLDAFIRLAGRKLRGFSDCEFGDCSGNKKGYLSHPYWYFNYQENSDEDCETQTGYNTSGSTWTGSNVDDWIKLADCVHSHGASVPDNFKKFQPDDWGQSGETVVTETQQAMEDTCRSVCEQKLPGFRLAVIDAYHRAGWIVQGDKTMPDGSEISISDPPNSISLMEVECMAWSLVDRCQENCTLSIVRDPGDNHIKAIGTDSEILAMKKAMTYPFEAHVPDGTTCPSGFELVQPTSRPLAAKVADYLNHELGKIAKDVIAMGDGPAISYEANRLTNVLHQLGFCIPSNKASDHASSLDTWSRASTECPPRDLEHLFILAQDIHGQFFIGSGAEACTLMYRRTCDRGETEPYVEEVCDDVCYTCSNPICFRWLDPEMPETNRELHDLTCEEMTSAYLRDYIEKQVQELIQSHVDGIARDYQTKCAAPSTIQDVFRIDYPLKQYHFTLYYYDRAGNLVKTVPPAGVSLAISDRAHHPAHTLVSGYEFNSLKQNVHSLTPDAGETRAFYDDKGRVRFMLDSKLANDGNYAYTKYDRLSRVIETGKVAGNPSTVSSANLNAVSTFPATADGTEKVMTAYTTLSGATLNGPQRFVQNRVTHVWTDDSVHTHYSYDVHGNVTWIEQGLPGIGKTMIAYDYDLISGRVLGVRYNEGMNDQFFHRYTYDEDQRLTTAKTSRDMVIWDSDLRNSYFDYGPLKRAEYGEDGVQGLDYVYTIQGWLKGINHPDLVGGRANDPGKDGQGSSSIAYDAFGMILHYYDGDFNRSSGGIPSPFNSVPPAPPATQLPFQYLGASLYDGNISSWTSSIMPVTPPPGVTLLYQGLSANQYHYDELGRLVQEDFIPQASASSLQTTPVDLYRSSFQYDPNGNIEHLLRNGYTGNKDMDDLEYHYYAGTNRLEWIHDAASPAGPYSDDIKDQAPGRYQYDAVGQLTADNDPAGVMATSWSTRGKMKTVVHSTGATTQTVTYTYDGFGNRIKKEVLSVDNFRVPPAQKTTTWYVHDAGGNVLAIYEQVCTFGAPPSKASHATKENENGQVLSEGGNEEEGADCKVRVASWLIYGSGSQGRIATVNPSDIQRGALASANGIYSRIVREKEYELKDHLGDVRIAISDMKTGAVGHGSMPFLADIRAYANNYAFGMEQPSRCYQSGDYRYGYDGQEKDDELSGVVKALAFKFREYDPRIGRFMSVDPLLDMYPGNSPYAFAENRPVNGIDLEGLEWKQRVDAKGEPLTGEDGGYDWVGGNNFNEDGATIFKEDGGTSLAEYSYRKDGKLMTRVYYLQLKEDVGAEGHSVWLAKPMIAQDFSGPAPWEIGRQKESCSIGTGLADGVPDALPAYSDISKGAITLSVGTYAGSIEERPVFNERLASSLTIDLYLYNTNAKYFGVVQSIVGGMKHSPQPYNDPWNNGTPFYSNPESTAPYFVFGDQPRDVLTSKDLKLTGVDLWQAYSMVMEKTSSGWWKPILFFKFGYQLYRPDGKAVLSNKLDVLDFKFFTPNRIGK